MLNRSIFTGVRPAAMLAAASLICLAACAPGRGGKKPDAGNRPVQVEDKSELADLAKGLKTKEDSLILDLLQGYRMMLLRDPDAKSMDKETLQRSRGAYERLEFVLRHGGVKAQEGGERVFTITNEDRLSLQEVIRSASMAAGKAAREGDWERARARWREIVQSKPAVTLSMEEAQWGLALADALESPLPDPIKKKLKDVDESYAMEINHEEIGKQVKPILEEIKDEKLRRELKRLVNRAWDRDKKAGRLTPMPTEEAEADPSAAAAATATSATASMAAPGGSITPTPDDPAHALVDTLAAQGRYMAAMKALEKTGEPLDQGWGKEKKMQIGGRFCEDKRRSAANAFKDFKKAASDADKRNLLQRTAGDLDSCLFYFPELPVSQKVRRNRDMVEAELKKLKP